MNTESGRASEAIAATLRAEVESARRRRTLLRVLLVAFLIGVILTALLWVRPRSSQSPPYVTAKVERGDLTVVVTATGTLQPTNQVDVGSELSGIVRSVSADFNDAVKVGQILAELDTTKLAAQVLQSEAMLRSAQARVREAEANEDEMRRRLVRAQELFRQKFVSEEALISARAAADRTAATVQSVRSAVDQARATLEVDRTNLAKAVIRSPINGTVLARKVEPGQTVAATLQTPVLFTLAEDLKRMELHVDVDEADVGQVRTGQAATFTVAAYPAQEFESKVTDVRNAAKTVNGVVTYETVLSVDNEKLLLRPGMTGTANIVVSELRDTLLVPNAALRFAPPVPAEKEKRSLVSRLLPIPPRPRAGTAGMSGDRRHQRVWVLRDEVPVAIPVTVGASDGRMTAVLEGELQPGVEVLIDVVERAK
jgi:HlyD family secretion protein